MLLPFTSTENNGNKKSGFEGSKKYQNYESLFGNELKTPLLNERVSKVWSQAKKDQGEEST